VAVVIGSLVFLMAGGLLTAGAALGVAGQTLRDDQGFLNTPAQPLRTSTYAIASEPMLMDSGGAEDAVPGAVLGDVKLRAEGISGEELFIGIAPADLAARYLSGVEHATLVDIEGMGRDNPVYRESAGGAPSSLPNETDIWVAATSGPGEQQLSWAPRDGRWTVVMMNADGSSGVGADVSVGAMLPVLGWVAGGLLVGGLVLLVIAIALLLAAVFARPSQQGPPAPQGSQPTAPQAPPAPLGSPTPSAPPHA
jgi:hypothetical protein